MVQYANDAAGKPLYWVALVDNVAEVPAEGSTFWENIQYIVRLFGAFDPQRNFARRYKRLPK
ncbi:MAG: hypothetical protein ACLU99_15015 [Alphaproteobacteria bacterium]